MSSPELIPTVRVTATYLGPDKRPLKGTVTFTGPPLLTFPESDLFIAGPVVGTLDEKGQLIDPGGILGVSLPATDSPNMNPTGWAYTVKESLTGATGTRTYAMLLPKDTPGASVDLADVAPADPTTPTYVPVAGPVGPQGAPGIVQSVNGVSGAAITLKAQDVNAALNTKGIWVPPGWGSHWRSKLTAGHAVMAAIGSSSTQGYYASNLRTKSWLGLLRASLQTTYGNGGSGYRSSSMSTVFQAANSVPAAATTAYTTAGNLPTLVGTWSAGGSDFGPGAYYLFTQAVGATYTLSVNGTSAKIFTVDAGGNHANWTYAVDGGAPVAVTDGGAAAQNLRVTTITGLTAGTHQIVLAYAGDGTKYLSVCGIAGESATGVTVNDLSRYGSRAQNFSEVDQALAAPFMAGAQYPADLVLLCHAPNEANANNTVDNWARWQRRIMQRARTVNPNTDLMIVLPHVGTFDDTNLIYHDYAARGRVLAEAFNAAFVDMWTLGGNTWGAWSSLGYWSDATNPGAAGNDAIHPSDAGHQFIADTLLPIIT